MAAPLASGARFVDPAVLARVGNLEFVARSVVDGVVNGLHRSPLFGTSVDFAEHRGYVAGDDLRRLDWKVFGRTDKFYVKEFEADSNAAFTVLLDVSASMAFGERLSKLDYARTLAACLLYLVHQQRDRVGLATFDTEVRSYVPAASRHLNTILHTLDRVVAERPGAFEAPVTRLAQQLTRRGIVVVISDLYADPDDVFRALAPLRFRGHDVLLFHVLDRAELEFPYESPSTFEDLEDGEQVAVSPDALRSGYLALMQGHLDALATRARGQQIDYLQLATDQPLDHALYHFLSARDRAMRTR